MSCFVRSYPAPDFIVLTIRLVIRLWVIVVFRTDTIELRKFFTFGIFNLLLKVT